MNSSTVNIQFEEIIQERAEYVESAFLLSDYKLNATTIRKNYITEVYGRMVLIFLEKYIDLSDPANLVLSTATRLNIINQIGIFRSVINLKKINDIRHINKFFEAVNLRLPNGGRFIGCVETHSLRKQKILKKYPNCLNYAIYTLDYIVKRIFPKLMFTKKLYFILTRGQNRLLSKAETLGRLIACGFEIEELHKMGGNLYFVARKIKPPMFPEEPSYGPLIKLKRIGKNGKIIKVYKLRTMHPFSEFLQDYIYNNNNLDKNGKFKNDFRVCTLGKFMRKFWLDELPMFINLFKGDLKLVGVRPLSPHYFGLYDEAIKQKRIQTKPGLFPPFYADMPKTMEEIMDSERKYLEQYEKNPVKTDFEYLRKALFNIVFKGARSS